jgi:hypothetical protein
VAQFVTNRCHTPSSLLTSTRADLGLELRGISCSPLALADAHAPGWALSNVDWARGTILWHSGSAGRNHALVHIVPEEGFATCMLTNIEGMGSMPRATR